MTDAATVVLALFSSSNTVALVALVFRAGRYAERVERVEKQVFDLEASKTDVSLARLEEQFTGLRASMDSMQRDVFRIGEAVMGRQTRAGS